MPYFIRPYFLFCCLFPGTLVPTNCRSQTQEKQPTEQAQVRYQKHRKHDHVRAAHQREKQQRTQRCKADNSAQNGSSPRTRAGRVAQKVYKVPTYVQANNRAMPGYVGGRRFGNFENHLPRSSTDGKPIEYQEWDVNPKVGGRSQGTQRLVTGSDGRTWFTDNHYNTFAEVN